MVTAIAKPRDFAHNLVYLLPLAQILLLSYNRSPHQITGTPTLHRVKECSNLKKDDPLICRVEKMEKCGGNAKMMNRFKIYENLLQFQLSLHFYWCSRKFHRKFREIFAIFTVFVFEIFAIRSKYQNQYLWYSYTVFIQITPGGLFNFSCSTPGDYSMGA